MEIGIILSVIGLLNGAQFFYARSMRGDIKEVGKDLKQFKNGHFADHMTEAEKRGREEGRREKTEDILCRLHERLDRLEGSKLGN